MENNTIKVNKMCYINEEDIAKAKDRDIAVSVTSVDAVNGKEEGFINFTLGIENHQECCEYWGTYLFKEENKEVFFVNRIEVDVDLTDKELDIINENTHWDLDHNDITCVKIYGKKNELIAKAIAYNQHNGCYSHAVEALENGQIVYDSWL